MPPLPKLNKQGTISTYKPTLAGRVRDGVANGLQWLGVDPRYSYHVGDRASSFLNEMTPAGSAFSAQDARNAYQQGRYGAAAGNGLVAAIGLVPGAGKAVGRVIGKGSASLTKVANEGGGLSDPISSLAKMLHDPRPTHALYRKGDVLTLSGAVGKVVGETDAGLVLSLPQGSVIVPRNDPRLAVADPKDW